VSSRTRNSLPISSFISGGSEGGAGGKGDDSHASQQAGAEGVGESHG